MLIVVGTTAVLSTSGLVASTWIRSPAEIAAETAPPPASMLTAPVESKVLQRTLIFRGKYSSVGSLAFAPSTVLSPDGARGAENGDLLVTRAPRRAGDKVQPGMLLAEVSYRPVFALHGRIPALRDLVQGMHGRDVSQVQDALTELGYDLGSDRKGHFGADTAAAIKRYYARLGYPVPTVAGRGSGGNGSGVTRHQEGGAAGVGKADRLVQLPKSEVVFIPSFPARIVAIDGSVGKKVSGDLLRVSVGGVRLIGRLDPSEGKVVKPGQAVQVLLEESGDRYRGTVAKVGDLVTPKATGQVRRSPYIPVRIKASGRWKADLNGQDAQIRVTAAATDGRVLSVPLGAITAPADGKASVIVVTAVGERRRVRVTAGMSADGYVEVTPEGGRLREGDQVVVGR